MVYTDTTKTKHYYMYFMLVNTGVHDRDENVPCALAGDCILHIPACNDGSIILPLNHICRSHITSDSLSPLSSPNPPRKLAGSGVQQRVVWVLKE